ncbi:Uncharacterised protein [Sporosarcina pasteurii]|uniref:Uncharacterized protein n=1 Tax=Sporosarcina pasteurii TaxID=1474 RepID=A0A380CHC7_SPOPA|nr:Uncharacterised protein [Sporosarcina pasteurii]
MTSTECFVEASVKSLKRVRIAKCSRQDFFRNSNHATRERMASLGEEAYSFDRHSGCVIILRTKFKGGELGIFKNFKGFGRT